MKKLLISIGLLLLTGQSYAGLIHRPYTWSNGDSIAVDQVNQDENVLVNEINGNLSTTNILDGTLQNGDFADTQFVVTKFAATVQSTFTYINQLGAYRRPNLTYVSGSTLDIEGNTGTANETCLQFPDERRCVTENTGSTSVNRRLILSEAASNSGTKNSGLRTGYVETANTFYSLYGWKVSDNSTDFVIVADTIAPVQANFSTLNTFYGNNAWVYIGTLPNGDGNGTTTDFPTFKQVGKTVCFSNSSTGQGGVGYGARLATTGLATSLTWTYSSGFALGSGKVPPQLTIGTYLVTIAGTTTLQITDAAATMNILNTGTATSHLQIWAVPNMPLSIGLNIQPSGLIAMDIFLTCYEDGVLGVGMNPQL